MNFWHIQLHPGTEDVSQEEVKRFLELGIIGMGSNWEDGKGKTVPYPNQFRYEVQIGDVFYVHSSNFYALVEVISDVLENVDGQVDAWFGIYRRVKLISDDRNKYRQRFSGSLKEGVYLLNTMGKANNSPFIKFWYNMVKSEKMKEGIKGLLEVNHNIVLHGAPGTGKTYMAREIAKEMGAEVGFVQFHPSYDYTDFVEGLRPVKKEGAKEIGFERKDGVFKSFCKKALEDEDKKPFVFVIDEINRGDMSKIFGELFFSIDPGYRVGIEDGKAVDDKGDKLITIRTQYANMITEPNEFDETLGITNEDGYGHFFIPDNVYIIGTMNDIDRSVESMDFAMRIRFAFVEVEAKDDMLGAENFKKDGKKVDCIDVQAVKNKMNALNKAIWDNEKGESSVGLTKDYQIGGAYFLKYALYYDNNNKDEAFKKLWKNHLESVLKEYLRGTDDDGKKLENLKNAYYGKTGNNGQPSEG